VRDHPNPDAEEPYITLGICASLFYFGYFLVLVPVIGLVENTLADVGLDRRTA
jgi:ubiquinol-cytochrome c reductase cytochrome b subunit